MATPRTRDRPAIERLVPHAGDMCLLDAVLDWDATRIECAAAAPNADHPLARGGRVPAIAACEYAGQASAVHGALIEPQAAARAGLLAKLMDVDLPSPFIPDGQALHIRAEVLGRVPDGCLYAFDVASAGRVVARGRLMVAFENRA